MMLLIRCNHDLQTSYLYSYTDELVAYAKEHHVSVTIIEDRQMDANSIASRIQKTKPRLIFFNGHGSKTALFNSGQDECINIESAQLFEHTIAYTIACDALISLGSAAVAKGCDAFIGYDKPFWIARNHKYESRPLEDPVAKPILECSNLIVKSLLKGNTVGESIRKSREKAADNIMKLVFSKELLAPASLQALIANDEALGFKGDESVKL